MKLTKETVSALFDSADVDGYEYHSITLSADEAKALRDLCVSALETDSRSERVGRSVVSYVRENTIAPLDIMYLSRAFECEGLTWTSGILSAIANAMEEP